MLIKLLAGTVAGGVVMFLLGFLIWGVLLFEFFKTRTTVYAGLVKAEPDMILVVLFNLIWALLYTLIFVKWAGIRTFAAGASAGALISLLIALVIDVQFMAFMNLYTGWTPVIVDVLAAAVVGGIAGGVIGLVLGKLEAG